MKILSIRVALAATLASVLGVPAVAQDSGPLICTIARGIECGEDYECAPPVPGPDVPRFIHVDADNDTLTLLDPESRRGETSTILAKSETEDYLAISGIDANRVWSAVIDHNDRSITITLADEEAGFVVFGHCIAADKLSPE